MVSSVSPVLLANYRYMANHLLNGVTIIRQNIVRVESPHTTETKSLLVVAIDFITVAA